MVPNPAEAACVIGPNPVCVAGVATDALTWLVGGAMATTTVTQMAAGYRGNPSTDKAGNKICQAAYSLPPPGNCSPKEQEPLQKNVDEYCKPCSTPTICTNSMSPAVRSAIGNNNRQCAMARDLINNKCFMGGDRAHRDRAIDAWKNMLNASKSLEFFIEEARLVFPLMPVPVAEYLSNGFMVLRSEDEEVIAFFSGRSWGMITDEQISENLFRVADIFYVFSPQAVSYYLPALCIYCLRHEFEAGRLQVNLLEALQKPDIDDEYATAYFTEMVSSLSLLQRRFISYFLNFTIERESDRKINERALKAFEFWLGYM
ncbi:DUF6714 family protein [Chitiniphilus shinanonensis]|uniref:DUF6714 family protein n=1 Tax=Chitiniphilus shinanonensis TaxID=553088 RepID=UPI00301FC99B